MIQRAPAQLLEATVLDPPVDADGFLRVELDNAPGEVLPPCPWLPRIDLDPMPDDAAAVVMSDGGNFWVVAWWSESDTPPRTFGGSDWFVLDAEPPADTLGAVGDLALVSSSGNFYEKAATGLWELRGSLRGPGGPAGPAGGPGPAGPAGASAYDVWLAAGNVGDVNAYLASLKGATGNTGPAGPANSLAVGAVTTGAPGSAAAASITGVPPAQTLALTIPRGDVGAAGPAGAGAADLVQSGVLGAGDCGLTVNSTTSVTVAGGVAYLSSGARVAPTGATLSGISATSAGNARLDQVAVQTDGSIVRVAGAGGSATTVTLASRSGAGTLPAGAMLLWDILVTSSGVTAINTRDRRRRARGTEYWGTAANFAVDGSGPAAVPTVSVETGAMTLWLSHYAYLENNNGAADLIRLELAIDGTIVWTPRWPVGANSQNSASGRFPATVTAGRHTITWSFFRTLGLGTYVLSQIRFGVEESLRPIASN